ncbi:MAG TPA: hypothetical protein VNS50_12470 [Ginsengibacter sp.]|nr:hypothetical protein [Ginsengibacter sp.]
MDQMAWLALQFVDVRHCLRNFQLANLLNENHFPFNPGAAFLSFDFVYASGLREEFYERRRYREIVCVSII